MFLGKANKIFNTGSVRTINTEIKNIERIISCSNNRSCKLKNCLILHGSRYPKTEIKRWDDNCTYLSMKRFYSIVATGELVDSNTFEKVCEETLCSLADYFEDLVANDPKLEKADVMYGVSQAFMYYSSSPLMYWFQSLKHLLLLPTNLNYVPSKPIILE